MADVEASDGKVLVDVEKPVPCCMTLEAGEAIDLAQQLIAAAVEVTPSAGERQQPPAAPETR
ncbi:hypothetical protein KZ820_07010 [Sphingomonas sp. RRHST34]|uniref:Uncharacterized protein n=1 Tax=Sphingomonas citri TaxID=2862499 RepID=A0ABS7BLL2_9SPHN|nr:hypothetical protein [Sphingomonas citri]MBW6530481.1 hypothetical protein [Sphingomonas citri]